MAGAVRLSSGAGEKLHSLLGLQEDEDEDEEEGGGRGADRDTVHDTATDSMAWNL